MQLSSWVSFTSTLIVALLLQFGTVLSIRVNRSASLEDKCASVSGVMPNVTVMYVNLDKRTDRRQQFESQLEKYFGLLKECKNWDWERQSGFDMRSEAPKFVKEKHLPEWMSTINSDSEHRAGVLGCYLSHLEGIKKVASTPQRSAFMFEDDFEFTADPADFLSKFQSFSQEYGDSGWDVLLVGHNQHGGGVEPTKIDGIKKLKGVSWTTSSYLVNSKYISALADVWQKHLDEPMSFPAVDEAWNELQEAPNSRWFKIEPRIGRQRQSFSDIEQTQTTYGVLQLSGRSVNLTRPDEKPVKH